MIAEAPVPAAIAAPFAASADEAIGLTADRLELDELQGVLTATGHVILTRGDLRLEAAALRFDRAHGTGTVTGPLKLTSPTASVTAVRAEFDLNQRIADLYAFRGQWGSRGQVWGEHIRLTEDRVELDKALAAACDHADPDLLVVADRFVFYPRSAARDLVAVGVGVRAAGLQLITLPEVRTHIDEKHRPGFDGWAFPSLGFDIYQGFLTATRLEFTLGDHSRGAIPIVLSTGRGLSAGIEHALDAGPGELLNAVKYETPWATGQGGVRALNAYQWRGRDGSRYELALDYRANFNEQAVHRLPEAVWTLPYYNLGGLLAYQTELRGGYLIEANTEVNSPRFRFQAPFNTPTFTQIPHYQTWVTGMPFANHYGSGHFIGSQLTWNHREDVFPDLALTQAFETVHTNGQTPFVHDRLIPADRIRLGVEKNWGPRLYTGLTGTWSRLYNTGPLLVEDLGVTTQYKWNCFSLGITLRPLIYGVETKFQLLD